MKLTSFSYSELEESDRQWSVDNFSLDGINLLVGQNASGKTRILNCIKALATLLTTKPDRLFSTGNWKAVFANKSSRIEYNLQIGARKITREIVTIDGMTRLSRDENGEGSIWNEQIQRPLDFKIDDDSVAAFFKRDEKQHAFLEPLFDWASSLRHYPFGTDFGKTTIFAASRGLESTDASDFKSLLEAQNVVGLYCMGYDRFGEQFDKAILSDFRAAGYDCEAVDAVPAKGIAIDIPHIVGKIPVYLQVKEKKLPCPTRQFDMSMGMFRCLALIIHITYSRLAKEQTTILIDDIGEGLDFERSTSLIKRLIKRCTNQSIQLVMSTNDRFVMNEVDLKHWHIVRRRANRVTIFDYENSTEAFEKFKFLGLSNFDFFVKGAYLSK
ncbi:ATP-binding protein [Sphingomonas sp. LB-2]|uniref:ATP-binding protein n=1 Tax=Sphingomonas caeni TaxID=2984949 RepID=UPI00222E7048|nr:ATP-binding protein [Sphingomonas caeni]MCW3848652.1 ATP-binding protein [Sphingomonas caeni]